MEQISYEKMKTNMSEMFVPTVNICEATARFRQCGISITETLLGNGIEQGVFPFGVCIRTNKGRRFQIYEKLLKDYLEERSVLKDVV